MGRAGIKKISFFFAGVGISEGASAVVREKVPSSERDAVMVVVVLS